MQAGKAIVAFFAAVIAIAAVVFVAYKVVESRQPAMSMSFERAEAPANTTVHALVYEPVHDNSYLEDHLVTALDAGNSTETLRIRVFSMRDTLQAQTGSAGPEWWVSWQGAIVRIALDGGAAPASSS